MTKVVRLLIRWGHNHHHVKHSIATAAQKLVNRRVWQRGDVVVVAYYEGIGRGHSFGSKIEGIDGLPIHPNFGILEIEIDNTTVKPERFHRMLSIGDKVNGEQPRRKLRISITALLPLLSRLQRTRLTNTRTVRLSMSQITDLESANVTKPRDV